MGKRDSSGFVGPGTAIPLTSGGTVSDITGWRVHSFTASGDFVFAGYGIRGVMGLDQLRRGKRT